MIRGTLTLLMRSIRADAQKPQAHAARIVSVIFILGLLISAAVQPADVGAPGLLFFRSISYVAVALIALAGMGHFATSVTEEREEGTLGLLLMADISPLAILLGKSTNRILSVWLVFSAQLPFAMLALTLGGLTVSQILAAYLALAAHLFLIANLALLMSVLARRMREATASMAILLLLLYGFVPWLSFMTEQMQIRGRLTANGPVRTFVAKLESSWLDFSIVAQIGRIFEPNQTIYFLTGQVLLSFGIGIALFLLAWLVFSRVVWAPEATQPPRGVVSEDVERKYHLVTRPWSRAMVWKDYFFLAGGPLVTVIKILFFVLYVSLCLRYADWVQDASGLSIQEFLRQSFLLFFVAEWLFYSSQIFHTEKRWGTLPTLLMLPQTPLRLASQKLLGCFVGSLPTLIAAAGTFAFLQDHESLRSTIVTWPMLWGICITLVLCQLTMDCSLAAKWGAFPLAVGILLVAGFVGMPFISATMYFLRVSHENEPYAQVGPIVYVTGMISAGLQFDIIRRMKLVASE